MQGGDDDEQEGGGRRDSAEAINAAFRCCNEFSSLAISWRFYVPLTFTEKNLMCGPATEFFQLLSPRFARSLAMIGTAGRPPMNRLQIRVWSGRWSPHSNHCAAGAAMRIPASAGRTTRFRQKSLHRQLVSRAGQSGRTKNGRQSCPTRRERARPSNEPMTRQRAQLQGRVISGLGATSRPLG